jgi:hypothetical protein
MVCFATIFRHSFDRLFLFFSKKENVAAEILGL